MSRYVGLLAVCMTALTFSGCSRLESPAPTPTSQEAPSTPAAATPTAIASEPPAESSLALKRGLLVLAAKRATFQPCGEQTQLWVMDQTDGVLRQTFATETTPLELYVEAHGERVAVPDTLSAAARTYPGAFILEEVLYATTPGEGHGCKAAAPNYVVAAQGNEPFWSVEVTGEKLLWRQPAQPREISIDAPESQDAEGTVGYKATGSGHTIELFVEAQACRDSMSGAFFAYSARALLDGKEFKGCARIGE